MTVGTEKDGAKSADTEGRVYGEITALLPKSNALGQSSLEQARFQTGRAWA